MDLAVASHSTKFDSGNRTKWNEWVQKRSWVLVRRDPIPGAVEGQQRWAVLCYNSCGSDEDCAGITTASKFSFNRYTDPSSFQCSASGHCQRTNRYLRSNYVYGRDDSIFDKRKGKGNTTSPSDLVILSYANKQYFSGLKELAALLRF